jgi:hypothetical protein
MPKSQKINKKIYSHPLDQYCATIQPLFLNILLQVLIIQVIHKKSYKEQRRKAREESKGLLFKNIPNFF